MPALMKRRLQRVEIWLSGSTSPNPIAFSLTKNYVKNDDLSNFAEELSQRDGGQGDKVRG